MGTMTLSPRDHPTISRNNIWESPWDAVKSCSTTWFDPPFVIECQDGAQMFDLMTQESRLLHRTPMLVQEDSHHARSQHHVIHMRVQADFIQLFPILPLEIGGRASTGEILKKCFDVFVHAPP